LTSGVKADDGTFITSVDLDFDALVETDESDGMTSVDLVDAFLAKGLALKRMPHLQRSLRP
jgi:hypothetical protein